MSDKTTNQVIQIIYAAYILYSIYSLFQSMSFMNQLRKRHGVESDRKKWRRAAKAFKISVRKLKKMSKDEIKTLYRKMSKKVHPDVGGNADKFRDLNHAYKFAYAAV